MEGIGGVPISISTWENDLREWHIRFHRETDNVQLKTCAIFFNDEIRDLRDSFI
jgi:hypothetical protein